jgi:SAM-dependent methyltransferase
VRRTGLFQRIVAVEPTPDLAETCRARGLEVVQSPVEEIEPGAVAADVVASFEVLEHLFSPRQFLEGCHRLLSPGGILVLTCPNVKGFEIEVLQERSGAVDTEHLNYFHPASLTRLLADCGYEALAVETPGKLDVELVRQQALAGHLDLSARPFLSRVLVEEWDGLGGPFQRFLAENGLSSHMWAVGRKPV